jgi:hypothetical protein
MKARVKATGEIVEARGIYTPTIRTFGMEEIESYDMEAVEIITDPDYWTRLEHQYAGMAMQGILSNANHALWDRENNAEGIAKSASAIAHALVQKLKEKEADR